MTTIDGFFVYFYHHDDDMRGFVPVDDFRMDYRNAGEPGVPLTPEFKAKLYGAFKHFGWEGDGVVEAMFVPPFFSPAGYSNWFPVFHVKQNNNGTSWIASEQELGFAADPASDLEPYM